MGCPLINIHHSFLPAFIGAARHRRAKERGVKLVGATAHHVTENLDERPVIEQDVVRIDHFHSVDDLTRLDADVERAALSRAVLWHCEDRIIGYGNQTIAFEPGAASVCCPEPSGRTGNTRRIRSRRPTGYPRPVNQNDCSTRHYR